MREIEASAIADAVRELFLSACCVLGSDFDRALDGALQKEESEFGRAALLQIKQNAALAREKQRPCCQDTGMAVVFMELGQDVHVTGGDINEAVNEGVRRAYVDGYLRKSVLSALRRENTGDNTPAILHVKLVPGEHIKLTAAPKGFGSENMSRLALLKPSDGVEGVKRFVVETAQLAGGNPCPPIILGVGIGGTMEKAALMAKENLTRDTGAPSPVPYLAALEAELLERVNALGIGPMGWGGRVTALAVHVSEYPTHIAGLPVAVNVQCHAARHKCCIL